MSTVQTMNTTTFQHAPYGYNAVPEQFRTIQSLTPPQSPPVIPAPAERTLSLGALTSSSDSSSFEIDEPTQQKQNGAAAFYHPFPQMLPVPVHHFSPAHIVDAPVSVSRNNSNDSYNMLWNNQPVMQQYINVDVSPVNSTAPAPLFTAHPERITTKASSGFSRSSSGLCTPKAQGGAAAVSSGSRQFSTFKAHHYLEKAGLPYHQFPNGGNLPTPNHWPQHCTIDGSAEYPNTYRAFIGQVRFETTTEQIAWVLEQTSGVTAAFVAYHRNGCFVAHFFTQQDCEIAVNHHKKVLFDLNGVWDLAATGDVHGDAQKAVVVQQVLRNKPNLHKHRLPRGCMVIEPFASTRNVGGLPTFPHHQSKSQQQNCPSHHYANIIASSVHSRDNSM